VSIAAENPAGRLEPCGERVLTRDLVFVSLEDWDEVWRRNQFLCASLARRFSDRKILFVGLPRDVSHQLRRGRLSGLRRPTPRTVPGLPNITVTHPLKLFPNSLEVGRRLNEALARSHVQQAARELGIRYPLLWLNPHSAVHMAGRMGEAAVVYDITDDWTLASFPERESRLIQAQDRALCRRADLVVVCSEALRESRRPLCRRLLLLPNGVDAEHYREVSEGSRSPAAEWPSPVFGYTGTLHSDRIDASLIVALARAFPRGSVVLVGPDSLNLEVRAVLAAERNVHLTGPVPYQEIPRRMAGFDVCIVPHRESAFTETLNPIKLWEYLAGGKPVVSSNVAGFRDYRHLCRIASAPDDFVAACREALAAGDVGRETRMAEARKHSWEARVDTLLDAMCPL
jgi:teichuronic acid biosynthesis glycosyltransferase TuaH